MQNRCIASRMHPTVVPRSRPQPLGFLLFCFASGFATPKPSGHTPRPISRPSAGVVEGVERQGCRESREGHGWPFVACPWSGTGGREPRQSRGRMQGWAFFCLLFFAQTKKSEAPCKAQPVVPGRGKRNVQNPRPAKPKDKSIARKRAPTKTFRAVQGTTERRRSETGALLRECTLRLSSAQDHNSFAVWFSASLSGSSHQNHQATPLAPSEGRAQVSWRGLSGRDAARAARAMDGPSWRAPGAAPEGGNPGKAGAGCRGGLSFAYFSLPRQRKVRRRARRNLPSGPRKARRPKRQIVKPKDKSFARKRAPTKTFRAVQGASCGCAGQSATAPARPHVHQRLIKEAAPAPPNSAALVRLNHRCPRPVRRNRAAPCAPSP